MDIKGHMAPGSSSTTDDAHRPPGDATKLFLAFAFTYSLLLVGCGASPPRIDRPGEAELDSGHGTTDAGELGTPAATPDVAAAVDIADRPTASVLDTPGVDVPRVTPLPDAGPSDRVIDISRVDVRPASTDGVMPSPVASCTNEGQVVTTGIPVSCETLCVCRNMVDDGNCHAAYATRELCIADCYAKKFTPAQLCCMAARCTETHIGNRKNVPGFTFKGLPMPALHHELCAMVRACQ